MFIVPFLLLAILGLLFVECLEFQGFVKRIISRVALYLIFGMVVPLCIGSLCLFVFGLFWGTWFGSVIFLPPTVRMVSWTLWNDKRTERRNRLRQARLG